MKKIESIIIQSDKLEDVKEALLKVGIIGMLLTKDLSILLIILTKVS